MYRVYGMATSGNCHRVQLALVRERTHRHPAPKAWIERIEAQPRLVPMVPMP